MICLNVQDIELVIGNSDNSPSVLKDKEIVISYKIDDLKNIGRVAKRCLDLFWNAFGMSECYLIDIDGNILFD